MALLRRCSKSRISAPEKSTEPCKHAAFIMCRKGLDEYPAQVTAELLKPSRKRGRPKKARPGEALLNN